VLLVLQVCGYAVGLTLELLIIAALLRGGYRQFPLVFLYTVVDFLTTVIEIRPSLAYAAGAPHAAREWVFFYWLNERIMQTLMLLVVISLGYVAAAQIGPRRTVLACIICSSLIFAGVSLLLHYDPRVVVGRWMTPWTRDLNFFAAVLDMVLWMMLIRPEKKDYRLLLLSGALGIQFTGQAIGQSVRTIAQSLPSRSMSVVLIGNVVIMLANLAFLYVWWRAFRRPARQGVGTGQA
jgi:hypothetical protein